MRSDREQPTLSKRAWSTRPGSLFSLGVLTAILSLSACDWPQSEPTDVKTLQYELSVTRAQLENAQFWSKFFAVTSLIMLVVTSLLGAILGAKQQVELAQRQSQQNIAQALPAPARRVIEYRPAEPVSEALPTQAQPTPTKAARKMSAPPVQKEPLEEEVLKAQIEKINHDFAEHHKSVKMNVSDPETQDSLLYITKANHKEALSKAYQEYFFRQHAKKQEKEDVVVATKQSAKPKRRPAKLRAEINQLNRDFAAQCEEVRQRMGDTDTAKTVLTEMENQHKVALERVYESHFKKEGKDNEKPPNIVW